MVWTALYSGRSLGEVEGKPGDFDFTVTALTFVKRRAGWALVAKDVVGHT